MSDWETDSTNDGDFSDDDSTDIDDFSDVEYLISCHRPH